MIFNVHKALQKRESYPPFHFGNYKIVFTQEICLLGVILLSSDEKKEFIEYSLPSWGRKGAEVRRVSQIGAEPTTDDLWVDMSAK